MRFPFVVCVFVCLAVITVPLLAQSPNGNINGLVSDPSGAAVAGAEVVAVNDFTHVPYTTTTNAEGIYALPNLPPGPYGVQVSKIGFKTLIKRDITVNIQDSLSINFTLLVGAFHEIVTVQGGASMVNTESAAVSTVVDEKYIANMPLNGRSFQDLILLTPGTVTQTPQVGQTANGAGTGLGMTGEFSVNGQRTESNYYTVDGVSANVGAAPGVEMNLGAGPGGSLGVSTALGTTQALVSVDDLQEFRVQSSTYSAEYGRTPGGQFSFETKSGTNRWQGTVYDYLRNGAADAQDWFNDFFAVPEPALRQNDFGGTVGGPVQIPGLYNGKDKTFLFVSYEGLRLVAPQATGISFVPDLCSRGVSPVTTCSGTIGPAPAALQPALNAFPAPNGMDNLANGIAQFISSWSNPSAIDSTSARFDHAMTHRVRFFFRFSDTDSSSTTRGALGFTPSISDHLTYTLRTNTAGFTTLFSNRLANDFRLNFSSNQAFERWQLDTFGGNTPIDLQKLVGLSTGSSTEVSLLYGRAKLEDSTSSGVQKQWNLVDTLSLSSGRHQLKFGADYRRLMPSASSATPFVGYFYSSPADLQENAPIGIVLSQAPVFPLYINSSAFAQDNWRLSNAWTLSFGLRWEVNPAPGVTRGLKPYTLLGDTPNGWTVAPQGTALWRTTWYNVAPRLGLANILRGTPGHELVLRAGVGVFFDTGQQLGSIGFTSVGFEATSLGSEPFPNYPVIPTIINPPLAPYSSTVYGFAPHLQLPFTLQWNGSVEQALGTEQTATLSYVGAHASRLLQENLFSPSNNTNLPYGAYLVENGLTSDYAALQVQFKRRLASGLTALASYTWSHCIDYGSENFNYAYQRGDCDFDVRQGISSALSYNLPNMGGNRALRVLAQNWGIDARFNARSAFPVTLIGDQLLQPNGQIFDGGLDFIANEPLYLYGSSCASMLQAAGELNIGQQCPGGRAINPNAFAPVDSGVGNVPRNYMRGFGAWQLDLAVRRELSVCEGLKLQIRAEAFNTFNHPIFGTVNGTYCSGTGCTFGQVTATLANSLGVLAPLYQMGGPRSMQLSLKLFF